MNSENPAKAHFLAQTSPFRALPASELDRLPISEKSYLKGETIYSEGDAARSVWIVREGRVEIYKYTSTGRPFVIEMLGPHELFGVLCRLGADHRTYPCTAIAEIDSKVIEIPERTFLDLYHRYPALVIGVCSLCSERFNAVLDVTCMEQEHVEKRVARTLLLLQKKEGNNICFTKREIGDLAGTTEETTIRIISGFSRKGWVSSSRGKLLIKDPAALQKLLTAS